MMKELSFRRVLSESEDETLRIGEVMAEYAFPGLTFFLEGDLGAGKTTLVRGYCRAAGCSGVRSPSFTLVNRYTGKEGTVVHSDLYRLDSVDPSELDLESYLDEESVLFVEWADRGMPGDFSDSWKIRFFYGEGEDAEDCRILEFAADGAKAEEALTSFLSALGRMMTL